jgi:uncharacterized metal-binding protein YceD (DUF177 family)
MSDHQRQTRLSHIASVAEIPATGRHVRLTADTAERDALAREFGLIGLPALSAELHLVPVGRDGLHVTGHVRGKVVQACVVTLEPVETTIDEPVDISFAPAQTRHPAGSTDADSEADPPEELVDGKVDLGGLVIEHLSIGIPDYPRKPGAEFGGPTGEPRQTPFADLGARLAARGKAPKS